MAVKARRDALRQMAGGIASVAGLVVLGWAPAARAGGGVAGDFRLVDPVASRERVAREIESLVSELNPLVRGIARRRLKETVVPAELLRIEASREYITVVEPSQPRKRAPADGSPVTWTNSVGDRVTMRMWIEGGALHERFRGQGNRDNLYRPTDTGLALSSKIFSRHFPRPLRFSLRYRAL